MSKRRLNDVDYARALLDERDGELRLNLRSDVAALALAFRRIRRESRAAPSPQTTPPDAPWYLADGSTVMLPAEEVTRRRKLAAKVIDAARHVVESDEACIGARGSKRRDRYADVLEAIDQTRRALEALDAASPPPGSAAREDGAPGHEATALRAQIADALRHLVPGERANAVCGAGHHDTAHACLEHVRAVLRGEVLTAFMVKAMAPPRAPAPGAATATERLGEYLDRGGFKVEVGTSAVVAPVTAADDGPCVSCGHSEDAHNSPIANGYCRGEWERCGCAAFRAPAPGEDTNSSNEEGA